MLSNMATSLILHKRIKTTVAKAKALKLYVEPLITKSKTDTTHSRRIVFGYLKDKFAVTELFREVSAKVADRPGGYTRILKTGSRLGDNAEMCMIELVDYNENMLTVKETKAKATRRRKPKAKNVEDAPKAEVVAEEKTAEVKEEVKADKKAKAAPKAEKKAEDKVEEKPKAKKAAPKKEAKSEDKSEDKSEEAK